MQQGRGRRGKTLAADPSLRTLVRLSVLYRVPLQDVLDWPAAHVRLISVFLSKEPSVEERLEFLLARFASSYHNANFSPKHELSEFLIARKAWPDPNAERYSDADRSVLATLMGGK